MRWGGVRRPARVRGGACGGAAEVSTPHPSPDTAIRPVRLPDRRLRARPRRRVWIPPSPKLSGRAQAPPRGRACQRCESSSPVQQAAKIPSRRRARQGLPARYPARSRCRCPSEGDQVELIVIFVSFLLPTTLSSSLSLISPTPTVIRGSAPPLSSQQGALLPLLPSEPPATAASIPLSLPRDCVLPVAASHQLQCARLHGRCLECV